MINDARERLCPAHLSSTFVRLSGKAAARNVAIRQTPKINRPKTMGPLPPSLLQHPTSVGLGGAASSRGLKFAFVPTPFPPKPFINHSTGLSRGLSAVHEPRRCAPRGPDIVTATRCMCTTVGALLSRGPSASPEEETIHASNHKMHSGSMSFSNLHNRDESFKATQ